jgi:alpha-ribazole phosphatase/probable phosphoglycerate mutase
MRITAVRHGETNENVAMIVQGQSLGTLSPTGQQQIVQLGLRLANQQFDASYCSDLERCRQTADAIIRYHPGLAVTYETRLRERSMCPFEGRKFADLDWDWSLDGQLNHKTPAGETWQDVLDRTAAFLNEAYQRHADQDVLLVTHGGPMRAMLALIEGGDWATIGRTRIDNCEIRQWELQAPVDPMTVR